MRVTAAALMAMLGNAQLQLLDARDAGQYTGARRRGPRGGHIPGAVNLPRELFFADGGGFLPPDEVRRVIDRAKLDPSRPVVTYCNGGVAATVLAFQLDRLGFPDVAVYDGSWNEWGPRDDLPTESSALTDARTPPPLPPRPPLDPRRGQADVPPLPRLRGPQPPPPRRRLRRVRPPRPRRPRLRQARRPRRLQPRRRRRPRHRRRLDPPRPDRPRLEEVGRPPPPPRPRR